MARAVHLWRARAFLLLLAIALALPCAAQEAAATGDDDQAQAQAGPHLAGPSSVTGQLAADSQAREAGYRFAGLSRYLAPYYDFKARVKTRYGFDFGADYNLFYQDASRSPGEKDAAGGVFRVFGTWTALHRGRADEGGLTCKVESRHRVSTPIAPQDLGSQVGYAGLTAVPFSNAGWLLTNLFWHQALLGNRTGFVAGIVDTTDYLDVYGLFNPWTDFSNLAFSTDPTIAAPNQGLGFALRASLTPHIYALAGMADANGDPAHPEDALESFFKTAEYFEHVEVGWIGSFENRMRDNVHLTVWRSDERSASAVPAGKGVALSASVLLDDRWLPFLRLGCSDGGGGVPLERSVSAGTGYYTRMKTELLGMAMNWGRPSSKTYGPDARDQTTGEVFYRLQWSPHVATSLDLQYLLHPALNPGANSLWMVGLRVRASF